MSKEIIKLNKQYEKLCKACDLITELGDLMYKLDDAPKELLKKDTLNKKGFSDELDKIFNKLATEARIVSINANKLYDEQN